MPVRKLYDYQPPCKHAEHKPPPVESMNLSPGIYEYQCPECNENTGVLVVKPKERT